MTVAERLRPVRVYDRFVEFRAGLGMRILPIDGGPPTLPVLAESLRAGGFVCLLADRDLSRSAVDVTLCGEAARMPSGPARLARDTGAALVPARWLTGAASSRSPSTPRSIPETTPWRCRRWPTRSRSASGRTRRTGT